MACHAENITLGVAESDSLHPIGAAILWKNCLHSKHGETARELRGDYEKNKGQDRLDNG